MKPTYWDVIALTSQDKISFKDACTKYNLSYKGFYFFRKKNNITCASRGKHPNSSRFITRKYNLDDTFFTQDKKTLTSCYWAGFIAADGNISKNNRKITISLQHLDREHLVKFKNAIKYEGDIKSYVIFKDLQNNGIKKRYEYDTIAFSSSPMINDLFENFNITPAKSLTLQFPKIIDKNFIDAFIKGYIDGDGSIGLNESNNEVYISVMSGSKPFIEAIANRFGEILDDEITIYSYGKKNIHTIRLSNKKARRLILYLNSISTPHLERKWDKAVFHSENFIKKHRNDFKLKIILDFLKKGLNVYEIAKEMNMTYQAIYYYLKKPYYKQLIVKYNEGESKQLDSGEVDIETAETLPQEETAER
jgi:predicted transcriptional regulator